MPLPVTLKSTELPCFVAKPAKRLTCSPFDEWRFSSRHDELVRRNRAIGRPLSRPALFLGSAEIRSLDKAERDPGHQCAQSPGFLFAPSATFISPPFMGSDQFHRRKIMAIGRR